MNEYTRRFDRVSHERERRAGLRQPGHPLAALLHGAAVQFLLEQRLDIFMELRVHHGVRHSPALHHLLRMGINRVGHGQVSVN